MVGSGVGVGYGFEGLGGNDGDPPFASGAGEGADSTGTKDDRESEELGVGSSSFVAGDVDVEMEDVYEGSTFDEDVEIRVAAGALLDGPERSELE